MLVYKPELVDLQPPEMKRRASQRVNVGKTNSPKENRNRGPCRLHSTRSQSVPPVSQRDDGDERCEKCQFAKKQCTKCGNRVASRRHRERQEKDRDMLRLKDLQVAQQDKQIALLQQEIGFLCGQVAQLQLEKAEARAGRSVCFACGELVRFIKSVKEDTPSPAAGCGQPSTSTSRFIPTHSSDFNAAPTFGYIADVPHRQTEKYPPPHQSQFDFGRASAMVFANDADLPGPSSHSARSLEDDCFPPPTFDLYDHETVQHHTNPH